MEIEDASRCLAEMGAVPRLETLRLLMRAGPDGLAVGEIQRHLGIPGSTLSHHLSRLVWAGLVTQTREGRVLRCRADFGQVTELLAFLTEDCCAGVTVQNGTEPEVATEATP